LTTAQAYLDSGEYLWNSGIFMVKASSWLQAMARYAPEILLACDTVVTNAAVDLDFVRVDEAAFAVCPSDSIDYAVMGKLSLTPDGSIKGYVVPMDAGWSDVDAWDTVLQVLDKDRPKWQRCTG
jgi:mannose-1-phosphate guanylyltransferase / mannose-6-phosphate isomerase